MVDVDPRDLFSYINGGHHLKYGLIQDPSSSESLFRDANIIHLPYGETVAELDALLRIELVRAQHCHASSELSLRDIAERILKEETELDLSKYNIYVSASGARDAIASTLCSLVSEQRRKVLFSSPNWIFPHVITSVPSAIPKSFHATTGNEFVEGFAAIADTHTAALILVDPANPLGYRLNRSQITSIEEIAKMYGIVPIFDDIFRGLQPRKKRVSASQYSDGSVIVEGTSKRYGARGLGVTWTLVPKSLEIHPLISIGCTGCDSIAATVIDALHTTHYEEKVRRMLVSNTRAFIKGYDDALNGKESPGYFYTGFVGMPIITYHLHKLTSTFNSMFLTNACESLHITSGVDWAHELSDDFRNEDNKNRLSNAISYVRICPTKDTPEICYNSGIFFGNSVVKLCGH